MKSFKKPNAFDGAKFAARYNLDALKGDFFEQDGMIVFPDALPDVPVFEAPDAPVDKTKALKAALDDALSDQAVLPGKTKSVFTELRKVL